MKKNEVIKSIFGGYFVSLKKGTIDTTKDIEKATKLTMAEATEQKEVLMKVLPHYEWKIETYHGK